MPCMIWAIVYLLALHGQLQEELAVFESMHKTIELAFADEQYRDDNADA